MKLYNSRQENIVLAILVIVLLDVVFKIAGICTFIFIFCAGGQIIKRIDYKYWV